MAKMFNLGRGLMVDRRIIRFTRIKSSPRSKKIRNIRERIVESSQCFRAESRNTQRYEGGINCKKESPLVVSVLSLRDYGFLADIPFSSVGLERYRWHRDDIAAKGLRRGRADRTKVLSGENGLAADESGRYPSDEKSRATPIETFFPIAVTASAALSSSAG